MTDEEKSALLELFRTMNRISNQFDDNKKEVLGRFNALESYFDTLMARLATIEQKVDRIYVNTPPEETVDPNDSTIVHNNKDDYDVAFKSLLAAHWHKNNNGTPRTSDQTTFVYDTVTGFASNEVESIDPSMYRENAEGRSWKYLTEATQKKMIGNVEEKALRYNVFLRHCKDHWLTRRMLSRKLLDNLKARKPSTK
jgi:hypothetical protein